MGGQGTRRTLAVQSADPAQCMLGGNRTATPTWSRYESVIFSRGSISYTGTCVMGNKTEDDIR